MVGPVLTITPDQPLPKRPEYADEVVARAFWRLSYNTGRKYVDGLDARGRPVVPPHEREREGYERRKQLTKPQNHAGPIIRRYNDHAFRRAADRTVEGADPTYQMLVLDADGKGTPLPEFMKRATRQAQVERECYLLPDSTKPADASPTMTRAQAAAANVRPFLRRIGADAVPWWRDHEGMLVEALVLLCREDGTEFARHYDAKTYRDVEFKLTDGKPDQQLTVASVGPAVAHPYGACPLVRLRPLFSDDAGAESQISPLAEIQQAITWHISLLNEEIANVTFSQMVATGISADQVKGTEIGNNRLLCLPNPAATITMIGALPAQAATIETRIANDIRELYRIAGVDAGSSTDGAGAAESGLAKAFKHNDLSANLSAIALSAQEAENAAMARVMVGAQKPPPAPARYPSEFDLPSLSDELNEAIRAAVTVQLPPTIRRKVLLRFATRNLALSSDEAAELGTELDDLDQPAEADPPASPPRRS